MAKAKPKNTTPPAADEWSPDHAFQYLTRTVGLRPGSAISTLRRALQDEGLIATCQHFVDGKLVGTGHMKSSFWRHDLDLELVDGHVVVEPLKALEPGEYVYTVPEIAVRLLTPPAGTRRRAGRPPEFEWDAMHAEALRRIDDNGPPAPGQVSEFTSNLLLWYANQFGKDSAPDFETARKYVVRWIEGWERSLPRS